MDLPDNVPPDTHGEERELRQRVAELTAALASRTAQVAALEAQLAAITRSESQYRAIVEATPVPILLSRVADGTILYANAQMSYSLGLPLEELIGRRTPDFYANPEDRAVVLKLLREQGQVRNHAVYSRRADGSFFWATLSLRMLTLREETILFAAFSEITAQKEAEEAARQSEERYRALNEAAFEGIVVHKQGVILECNQSFADLFGYTIEELVGMSVLELGAPESVEKVRHYMQIGYDRPYEAMGKRKDGTIFPGELCGKTLVYGGDEVRVVTARDLTERKEAEARQRLFERNLLETQKLESLGVLAGGIAHDFNNLLVPILGHASTLRQELAPESHVAQALAEIQLAAERASDLTTRLLAYAGKGRLVVQPLQLNALLTELSQLLYASISKRVTLVYQLQPDLPLVVGDATQLRQLIMNLVINASEAMNDQVGTITIATATRELDQPFLAATPLGAQLPPGPYVVLCVTDTGSGMDSETAQRIFDPFFTTKFTGRGLGLSAVHGIIRAHQGTLMVESSPGKGSRFCIFLPVSAASPPERQEGTPAPPQEQQSATVLVIDDEPGVRNAVSRMLQRLGYTVLSAADGVDGLAVVRAQQGQIHAVLLDMTMPHMTTEDIVRSLDQLAPRPHIILMSGYSEQELEGRFSPQDIAAFLHKPFTLSLLRDTLARVLAG